MKKTLAVLLAVLTALSALTMLSTLNTAAAGTWRSAYTNYINQKSGDAQARFKLVDIDGDDIPELIFYAGTSLGGMSVSSYGDSGIQTVETGSGGLSYVKGKIYCQYGKQGKAYCFQVQPVFGGIRGAYSSVATIVYTTISQEKPVINIENRSNSVYLIPIFIKK